MSRSGNKVSAGFALSECFQYVQFYCYVSLGKYNAAEQLGSTSSSNITVIPRTIVSVGDKAAREQRRMALFENWAGDNADEVTLDGRRGRDSLGLTFERYTAAAAATR